MRILNGKSADELRSLFIEAFVNKKSEYYKSAIREMRLCSDGLCYLGHLWDCFKNPEAVSISFAKERLLAAEKLYVMWDINSKDGILIPDYWKYPKRAVLEIRRDELDAVLPTLPEDAYFFDGSLEWTVALTHEYSEKNSRYCLFCRA